MKFLNNLIVLTYLCILTSGLHAQDCQPSDFVDPMCGLLKTNYINNTSTYPPYGNPYEDCVPNGYSSTHGFLRLPVKFHYIKDNDPNTTDTDLSKMGDLLANANLIFQYNQIPIRLYYHSRQKHYKPYPNLGVDCCSQADNMLFESIASSNQ